MRKRIKLIILLLGLFIIAAGITVSAIRYHNAAQPIIWNSFADGVVTVLESAKKIGSRTIEFVAQFQAESRNELLVVLYDPNEDYHYTTSTEQYKSLTIYDKAGEKFDLPCVNKCKQYLIYFSDEVSKDISRIEYDGASADVSMIPFDDQYIYYKSENGITSRAVYCTLGSSVLLYDAVLEKNHPLISYMRSIINQFGADSMEYRTDDGEAYELLIGGDGGTLLHSDMALSEYLPKGFGVFKKNPESISGNLKISGFFVKYYISKFHPIGVSKILKNNGIKCETKIVESIVWELEVKQFIS